MEELDAVFSAIDAAASIRDAREDCRRQVKALLLELIPVMDSLDRILGSEGNVDAASVELLRRQIEAVLKRQGVEEIGCLGACYDPRSHEAAERRSVADVPAGTILEQLSRGYRWQGELLRPPRVVVAGEGGHEQSRDSEPHA